PREALFIGGQPRSAQLGDADPVRLGPVADRFLRAGHRLGDRLQRHALAREQMELLDLLARPGLAVPLEPFRHQAASSSSVITGPESWPLAAGSRSTSSMIAIGAASETRSPALMIRV